MPSETINANRLLLRTGEYRLALLMYLAHKHVIPEGLKL